MPASPVRGQLEQENVSLLSASVSPSFRNDRLVWSVTTRCLSSNPSFKWQTSRGAKTGKSFPRPNLAWERRYNGRPICGVASLCPVTWASNGACLKRAIHHFGVFWQQSNFQQGTATRRRLRNLCSVHVATLESPIIIRCGAQKQQSKNLNFKKFEF